MTNRMANSSTLVAALDGLVALAVALVSAVQWNVGRMTPGGMSHFLEMRVTLLNATFGAVFVLIWLWTFTSLGLSRLEFTPFTNLKRTTVASAFMATFLLVLLVSRTTGPSVAIAATFFASVFGPKVSRRGRSSPSTVGRRPLPRWSLFWKRKGP
jgi:hypothetical protein